MRKLFLLLCLSGMLVMQLFAQDSHTISFEVSDVTQPSISMAADGKSFVFNIKGLLPCWNSVLVQPGTSDR
ncbi:MAG: hypothetical protein H3C36_13290 [Chitinophagaceae bacterium]|nr:hypothetical protein [Chitinophagaceae bacterium]MCW5914708.1 hypothetical protein [Chitinophagaceae bacterium]